MARRAVVLAVLLVSLSAALWAVDFSVGVRLGASGSLLTGTYAEDLSNWLTAQGSARVVPYPYITYEAGIVARVGFARWFALQTEFDFGPVGGGFWGSDGFDLLVGVSATEVSIPLLALFRIAAGPGTVSLSLGPFVAFPVGEPFLVENNGTFRSQTGLVGAPATLGALASAGYELPLGPGVLFAELRYMHRFLSVLNTDTYDTELFPLAGALTAGYMIPLFGRSPKGR